MIKKFQHIADLCEICSREGVKFVVISPGSRNAPLIDVFYKKFGDRCFSIVDERSAAYFGLGLARYTGKPVALICTSGTAMLNYSPALAEAYYAGIPLLAITADRPAAWIDQQDNQTIRQRNVYENFVKGSYHLPEFINDEVELRGVHTIILEAINLVKKELPGPVHMNVPLDEPLYIEIPEAGSSIPSDPSISENREPLPADLITTWKNAQKIMIVHGQDHPSSGVSKVLQELSLKEGIVVIAENISNVRGGSVINLNDILFRHSGPPAEAPEMLLYSGGQVVSRQLKKYLRDLKNIHTWRIGTEDYPMDTFKHNNGMIHQPPIKIYRHLSTLNNLHKPGNNYKQSWMEAFSKAVKNAGQQFLSLPFSEMSAMKTILDRIPSGSVLELGNSTPVRIFQFFNYPENIEVFSNRGVSGIDGCMSAAVGSATASEKLTILILGDLSFVYDSNALWNRRLPANLRAIIMNNSGGGIFGLLEGPSTKSAFNDFFIASHPVDFQKLVQAFYLDYFCCRSEDELIRILPGFFEQSGKARVLEIKTQQDNNRTAYRKMMNK